MTQEDKQLLLQDISARLPYGVKVKTPYNDAAITGITVRKGYKKDEWYIDAVTDKQTYPIKCIKPYLRSISSMTDEESKELENLYNSTANYISAGMPIFNIQTLSIILDWFNAHQFDYRGLISKGLAIDKQLM